MTFYEGMEAVKNISVVKEFILLGLTSDQNLQFPLFLLFLHIYILTLLSNCGIIILIKTSSRLHTPMYFLLSNLSFVDICYSSVITPNMLAIFFNERRVISFNGCVTQLLFFVFFVSVDVLLLAVMAYDRYYAICNPLLYSVHMTNGFCITLVLGSYVVGFMNALVNMSCLFRLHFCGPNKISHFYCDAPPLFKLSCNDTTINEIVMFAVAGTVEVGTLVVVFISYVYIITAVIRIRSSEGRNKAFSTCSSHLACVALFYCPALFMYLRPKSSYSMDQDRVASLFYTVIIPMLNPLIYSLRNKDMITSMRLVMQSCKAKGISAPFVS
ncbi:olfactory receptor 5AR1-like [Pleurodeles waltl]|uniref:olfactory receptor 5AR1-like n=1 Tax=Pleurodeles waltl TaxID=8319 RepID=UPI003709A201